MIDLYELAIRFKSEGFAGVKKDLDNLDKQGRGVTKGFSALKGVLGSLGLALGVREVVRYADTWKLIESRLRLVTESSAELNSVQAKLFAIAQETRTSFEATATLYARVAQNAQALGKSQQELADFTSTVQKSMKLSGTTTQEATAGVIQLSQAMASGVLRGDEFRSVMENMPGLARAIADGLNVPIGTLRKMANEGELTATKVIDAILKMKKSVDEDFKTVPVTIADAFTKLTNELSRFIGEADGVSGASNKVVEAINGLADAIPNLAARFSDFIDWLKKTEIRLNAVAIDSQIAGLALHTVLNPSGAMRAIGMIGALRVQLQELGRDFDRLSINKKLGFLGALDYGDPKGPPKPSPSLNGRLGKGPKIPSFDVGPTGQAQLDSIGAKLFPEDPFAADMSDMGIGMSGDALKEVFEKYKTNREWLRDEQIRIEEEATASLKAAQEALWADVGNTLGDAVYNAFSAAFNGEGIGGIFKAFGKTILAGLGDIITQQGQALLTYGIVMQAAAWGLTNPFTAGPAAIAAGAALIALGSAFGAIAKGGGGRGTAQAGAFRERSATADIVRLKFVDRPGSSRELVPAPSIHFTLVGANDPKVQREIETIVLKASRRHA